MSTKRTAEVFLTNSNSGHDIICALVFHVNTDINNDEHYQETLSALKLGKQGQVSMGEVAYITGFTQLGRDAFKVYWLTAAGGLYSTNDNDPYPDFLRGLIMILEGWEPPTGKDAWCHRLWDFVEFYSNVDSPISSRLRTTIETLNSIRGDLEKGDQWEKRAAAETFATLIEDDKRWVPRTIQEMLFYMAVLGVSNDLAFLARSPFWATSLAPVIGQINFLLYRVTESVAFEKYGYTVFNLHPSDDAGIEFAVTKDKGLMMNAPSGDKIAEIHRLL